MAFPSWAMSSWMRGMSDSSRIISQYPAQGICSINLCRTDEVGLSQKDASRDRAKISQTLPNYLCIPSFKMCSFPWRTYTEHPRLWSCRVKLKWSLDTARWLLRRKRPQGTFLPSANQEHSISRNHSSREPCLLAQGGAATIAQGPGHQTKKLNRHEGLRGGRRQKMYLVGTDPSKAARLASQVLVA